MWCHCSRDGLCTCTLEVTAPVSMVNFSHRVHSPSCLTVTTLFLLIFLHESMCSRFPDGDHAVRTFVPIGQYDYSEIYPPCCMATPSFHRIVLGSLEYISAPILADIWFPTYLSQLLLVIPNTDPMSTYAQISHGLFFSFISVKFLDIERVGYRGMYLTFIFSLLQIYLTKQHGRPLNCRQQLGDRASPSVLTWQIPL